MLDGIFIYDNAIHCYDLSDANLREDRLGRPVLARPVARAR